MKKNRIRLNIKTVRLNEDTKQYSSFMISLKPKQCDLASLLSDEFFELDESDLMNLFTEKIVETNSKDLAIICQKSIKRKNLSASFWSIIYNRIKDIKDSICIVDLIYIFYIYCYSNFRDKQSDDFSNFFWEYIEEKIKDIPINMLIYIYDCAERSEYIQKIEEIRDIIFEFLNDTKLESLELSESGLVILLKMLCKTERRIDERYQKLICNEITNTHFKDINSMIYSIHFLIKYGVFNETFKMLLNKIQFYFSFKNNDLKPDFKNFSTFLKFKDPFVLKEITRTLSVIYLSHKTNFR